MAFEHRYSVSLPVAKLGDKIDASPDGSKILFTKPEFGPPQSANVYSIGVDGTGLRQLTHAAGGKINDGADSWSPDGRKIAFVTNKDGVYRIYVMNANSSGLTRISGDGEAHAASWGTHP